MDSLECIHLFNQKLAHPIEALNNQLTIQLAWMTFWDLEIVNSLDCNSQQAFSNLTITNKNL